MICGTCKASVARVRIRKGHESCPNCSALSEAGGARLDGVLSRQRTRDQGMKYEGDTLNPWQYDKASRHFEPNPDFIKRHAVSAQNFFTPKDLGAYPKLATQLAQEPTHQMADVHGEGEYEPEAVKVLTQ